MEKITGQQYHIDITFLCQTHDFMKGLPTVVATDWVSLVVADMAVGGHQDADCVGGWRC